MGVIPKSERTEAGPTTHDALGLGYLSPATADRAAADGGSLTSLGYQVAIVHSNCSGERAYGVIDSAELYRRRPYAPGGPEIRAEAK